MAWSEVNYGVFSKAQNNDRFKKSHHLPVQKILNLLPDLKVTHNGPRDPSIPWQCPAQDFAKVLNTVSARFGYVPLSNQTVELILLFFNLEAVKTFFEPIKTSITCLLVVGIGMYAFAFSLLCFFCLVLRLEQRKRSFVTMGQFFSGHVCWTWCRLHVALRNIFMNAVLAKSIPRIDHENGDALSNEIKVRFRQKINYNPESMKLRCIYSCIYIFRICHWHKICFNQQEMYVSFEIHLTDGILCYQESKITTVIFAENNLFKDIAWSIANQDSVSLFLAFWCSWKQSREFSLSQQFIPYVYRVQMSADDRCR